MELRPPAESLTEADLFIKDVYNNGRSAKDLLTGQFSYISPLFSRHFTASNIQLAADSSASISCPTGTGFSSDAGDTRLSISPRANCACQARAARTRADYLRKRAGPAGELRKIVIPEVTPGQTTRQRFEAHRTVGSCRAVTPFSIRWVYRSGNPTSSGATAKPTRVSPSIRAASSPIPPTTSRSARRRSTGKSLPRCLRFKAASLRSGCATRRDTRRTTPMLVTSNVWDRRISRRRGKTFSQLLIDIATSDGFRNRVNQNDQ